MLFSQDCAGLHEYAIPIILGFGPSFMDTGAIYGLRDTTCSGFCPCGYCEPTVA